MARDTLGSLVGIRRVAERRALGDLADRIAAVEEARKVLGRHPEPIEVSGETVFATLDQRRAESAIAWAVWGERLGRLELARSDEERSRAEWATSAADLRATQRLIERRRHQQRLEASRKAQADLDDAAINSWRRRAAEQEGLR